MSDAVIISLISAVTSTVAAVVGLFNHGLATENTRNIKTIEKATNSMKDELVKVTGEKEFNRGLKEGTEAGKS